MFKKLIALTLLSAVFTVQASAASNENLDTIFRELNYSIKKTVGDADQKKNVTEAKKTFDAKFKNLQKEGLALTEMKAFALKTVEKNEALKSELETDFALIEAGVIPQAQAKELVLKAVKDSAATGSSFKGAGGVIAAAAIILIVAVALAATLGGGANVSVDLGACYDEYVCYDYYDDWGWYMYSDCWYETYCY